VIITNSGNKNKAKEKILIVEDEEDIQELIRYNLEKEGYNNLKVVDSGEGAKKALKTFSPDIV
jgi:two-component system phosphate regulon response regulator PhoB